MPKSSVVCTSGSPKWCSQTRLTRTRAVSGLSGAVMARARSSRPLIVAETSDYWYVYRVLGDPATGSFDGDPSGIPGQQIVRPEDVQVISPTPGGAADGATSGAYITLTTCHPKYSAQQRLIVHARLDGAPLAKSTAPDGPPALAG